VAPRQAFLQWQTYRLFPYERELGRREVASLFKCTPRETSEGLIIDLNGHTADLLKRLTYFKEIRTSDGVVLTPVQAVLESGTSTGKLSRGRQSTRYSAHGLHEYRGKFNPQVVRAIGNLFALADDAHILDPFCGSGTTLLESRHADWNALGLDLNPLAVTIANAKLQAIKASVDRVVREATTLADSARVVAAGRDFSRPWKKEERAHLLGQEDASARIPNLEYLKLWIQPSVMVQVLWILRAIEEHASPQLRQVFRLVLSDQIRNVSLQDPGDLRIRRRKDPPPNHPLLTMFADAVERRLGQVAVAKSALGSRKTTQRAIVGDSRELYALRANYLSSGMTPVAVISSPPYATALPYIDTQRLSLCILGLLDWRSIGRLERSLIGTRELGTRERVTTEERLACPPDHLRTVAIRCRQMMDAMSAQDGFRRRNGPALVFRYFDDMGKVLGNLLRVMAPNGHAAFVVGPNATTLNGSLHVIDTPRLLADIGERLGWQVEDTISLNTYQRFDMHTRNSIRSESLLWLRVPVKSHRRAPIPGSQS
jgi:hypothetical protein